MAKLFDELTALKEAYDKKLSEEGEDAVKELFKEFFDKHPEVDNVHWTQYTPYFNDGDPCYFSVHEFYLALGEVEEEESEGEEDEESEESDEDEDEDDYDYDEEYDSWGLSQSDNPKLKQIGEDLGTLQEIPDDVLEHVFGDHVRITATREGFDVDEYSHD